MIFSGAAVMEYLSTTNPSALEKVVVVSGLDVGGNVLYVVAREQMHVGLAAALIGLYPIVTMLLARFLAHGDDVVVPSRMTESGLPQ